MKEIYVVNCCRTAIGSFGGSLKDVPAPKLGSIVIREALNRAGIAPDQVDEVMMGCAITGALGQNISLVNITIFQLAVLLAFAVSWQMQKKRRLTGLFWQIAAAVVLLAVTALFLWWTYRPPQLPLFTDPVTGQAGRGL